MIAPDWAGYRRFRDGFAAAMDPEFHPIAHLDGLVLAGQARLWIGEKAAIAAEMLAYPGGARALHGLVAAGDLAEIRSVLIPAAEAWGRATGCTHAIIESRPGWARALRSSGYEIHQIALRKGL
jgi:hypothetical protein